MPIFLAGFTKSNSMKEMDMIGTLVRLADLGVTGIKVQYEGSGDSGCIENVVYTTEKMDRDEEAAFDEINYIEVWGQDVQHLQELDSGLHSDIENFVEDQLLQDIEDWWNNDGGYVACGGDNGLAKVIRLEMQSKDNTTTQLTMNQSLEGHSSRL